MSQEEAEKSSPVLHVVVIGFHHKKGCQVDYSFPPLIEGNPVDSHDVPEEWKHLPSLALPDGAHNYSKDTIFFHLPSRDGTCKTVYGVACYRQIDSSHLVNRTADVTRSTVQKSVCVLSRLPLYGLIQAKLELITHAYFDERDFSKVELLEETYKNLSLSMTESLRDGSQVFLGMSTREVVMLFRHKIVLLFKLILLERRVLFSGAPVQKLCNTILAVLSLFPGMIEFGLEEAASVGLSRQISPTLHSTTIGSDISDEYLEVCYQGENSGKNHPGQVKDDAVTGSESEADRVNGRYSQLHIEIENPENLSDSNIQNTSYLSSEPQSPEIPRDCADLETHPLQRIRLLSEGETSEDTSLSTNTQKNHENLHTDDAILKRDLSKHCDSEEIDDNKNSNRNSGGSLVQSETDANSPVILEETSAEVASSKKSNQTQPDGHVTNSRTDSKAVIYNKETDPFTSLNLMTQLSAVQTGQTFKQIDSVVNIEEFSDTLGKLDSIDDLSDSEKESSKYEKSLNLDDATEVLKRSGSVEELDSPESIQKIDQEDCFSWEEDRLLLAIEHKSDDKETSEEEEERPNKKEESIEKEDTPEQPEVISPDNTTSSVEEKPADTVTEKQSTDSDKQNHSPDTSSKESSPEKTNRSGKKTAALKSKLNSAFSGLSVKGRIRGRKQTNSQKESLPSEVEMKVVLRAARIIQDECGFPVAIFTKGCVCHPYLSLQYFDLLQDVNVRGFVLGATNILFRQKRHLTDVVVEVSDDSKIEFHARDLQRQLNLTTADHRFADIIVKAVIDENSEDKYLDGTEWEGGDEWLQAQFRVYLQSLLVTLKQDDTKLLDDFGTPFVQAYKTTHNYQQWASEDHPGMTDIPLGHPCQGNLGVSDLRMRLTHNLQGTERGKKINAAMVQTGKYVEQAGKVVGGAITNARSAMTSWFSSFTQDWKKEENQGKGQEN